jgi:hypothetical protein
VDVRLRRDPGHRPALPPTGRSAPYCVTIDFDTIDDRAVTVRERDTMAQDRVAIDELVAYLDERLR